MLYAMKKLRISANITAILGVLSVFALIFLFLALSDIAGGQEADLTLEWYIAGLSMIVLAAFTVSVFFTLGFLIKKPEFWNYSIAN